MLTRREVLHGGVALAAGPVAVRVGAGKPARQVAPVEAFLADARSVDALTIADRMAAQGVPVRVCQGDLGHIYTGCLAPIWSNGGVVAGVTGAAALFYLERLAWSHGQRIVFLGRHAAGEGHRVGGPAVMADAFQAGTRLTDWRSALAHTLLGTPSGAPALRPLSAVRDAAISGDGALLSWVLSRS
jgi:hypothetical protein